AHLFLLFCPNSFDCLPCSFYAGIQPCGKPVASGSDSDAALARAKGGVIPHLKVGGASTCIALYCRQCGRAGPAAAPIGAATAVAAAAMAAGAVVTAAAVDVMAATVATAAVAVATAAGAAAVGVTAAGAAATVAAAAWFTTHAAVGVTGA